MGDNHFNQTMEYYEYREYAGPIITVDVEEMFEAVCNFGVNSLLSFMGIVTNILTMIVFAKMGFKETSNITMTAIAFWNLFKCFLMAFYATHYAVYHVQDKFFFAKSYYRMALLFGLHTSNVCSYVAGALSAYVAIERCLCVCLPFTVKHLLTRKSVIATCMTIPVFIVGGYLTFFANIKLITIYVNNVTFFHDWIRTPFVRDRPEIVLYEKLYSQVVPFLCVGVTSVCTLIIIYKLRKSSKFRSASQRQDASSQLSARDTKIIKMLLVVVVVYVVCSIPWMALEMTRVVITDFSEDHYYLNLFYVLKNFVNSFSLVDASTNLFIFYNMSSEFHHTLRRVLCLIPNKKQ